MRKTYPVETKKFPDIDCHKNSIGPELTPLLGIVNTLY